MTTMKPDIRSINIIPSIMTNMIWEDSCTIIECLTVQNTIWAHDVQSKGINKIDKWQNRNLYIAQVINFQKMLIIAFKHIGGIEGQA